MRNPTFLTLTLKDLKIFFKDKFFSMITLLGLVFYIALFFIMPKNVNDKISLAMFVNGPFDKAFSSLEREDINIVKANSLDELKKLVTDKSVLAGYEFNINSETKSVDVKIYTLSSVEPELKDALVYIAKEMIYTQLGYGLSIKSENKILGEDLAGKQIPPQKRIIPVFAFFIIVTETLGIANLIADEIERKTIYALLVTKATIRDIFLGKSIAGLLTTLVPSLLFIIVTVKFSHFFSIFLILLLGSLFSISIGFLIGSIGKDIMSVIAWGALILIVLLLPSFNVMAPGSLTSWVKIIPAYYFIVPLHRVINFSEPLSNLTLDMLILFAETVVFFIASFAILRRRIYES